jgi:hypothetical protein
MMAQVDLWQTLVLTCLYKLSRTRTGRVLITRADARQYTPAVASRY